MNLEGFPQWIFFLPLAQHYPGSPEPDLLGFPSPDTT